MASVRKIAEGKYQVLWREPVRDEFSLPTGKTRQTSEMIVRVKDKDAQKAADDRKREIEALIGQGVSLDPSVQRDKAQAPLGAYAARYFTVLEPKIAKRTLDGYRDIYRAHIAPVFGARPIASILTSDVDLWHSQLLATTPHRRSATRSPRTAKQALGVLRRILNTSLIDGAISANPAAAKSARPQPRRQQPSGLGICR